MSLTVSIIIDTKTNSQGQEKTLRPCLGQVEEDETFIGGKVRSQAFSFVFKGKPRNVREARKQLDADYILEGLVLQAGQHLWDQMRIDPFTR